MVGLYFFQIVTIVLLAAKAFPYVFFLIPAPLITYIFHSSSSASYSRPMATTSLMSAAQVDLLEQEVRSGCIAAA
jgi:hypothetical protein